MTDPTTRRHQASQWREQESSSSEADIQSALNLLREIRVPSGLNDRVESRLSAAKLPDSGAMASHPPRARIAASILVVGLASFGLITHRSGTVRPVTPMPAALHRAPSSAMGAAGAIRLPAREVEAGQLTGGRAVHQLRGGRHTIARHIVLPRGVAVPHHPTAASHEGRDNPASLP